MTQSSMPTQEGACSPELPKPKPKPNPLLFIPVGLLIVGGGWYFFSHPKSLPNVRLFQLLSSPHVLGTIELSGRIEGYETKIGAKVAGRVDYLAVREGDQVRKGQVIARLNDAEIQAKLRGAAAQITAAQQRATKSRLGISVIERQIQEAQLNLQQSQGDARGRIYQAQAEVAQSSAQLAQVQAQVTQAKSNLKLAEVNRNRYVQLQSAGTGTQLKADQAQSTFEVAQATLSAREAAVDAARKQVNAVQGTLVQAQSTGLNPNIRNAQIGTLHA